MHRWLAAGMLGASLLLAPRASTRPSAHAAAVVHATLVSSEPAAGSRLATSPARVRLVFNEAVVAELSRVSLVAGDGTTTQLLVRVDPRNVRALLAPTGKLEPGAYRVSWRITSADGHPVDGSFVFYVGTPAAATAGATGAAKGRATGAGASAAAVPLPPPPPQERESAGVWGPSIAGAPALSALLRGLGVGTLMAACGLLAFAWVSPRARGRPWRLTTWLAVAAPLLLTAHLLAWLVNISPTHQLDAAWIGSALGTRVGLVEAVRVGLAYLVLWAVVLARRARIALVVAIAAVLTSGAVGHPAAIAPLWSVPAKAVHLVAGAVWLGGLLHLVTAERNDPWAFSREAQRVSSAALIAVIAVALTGVVQTFLFLEHPANLVRSAYGALVLAKVAGLVVLVLFGAYHRFRVVPALDDASNAPVLRRSVAREVVVMAVVILIGGLLAYVPPPHAAMDSTRGIGHR